MFQSAPNNLLPREPVPRAVRVHAAIARKSSSLCPSRLLSTPRTAAFPSDDPPPVFSAIAPRDPREPRQRRALPPPLPRAAAPPAATTDGPLLPAPQRPPTPRRRKASISN